MILRIFRVAGSGVGLVTVSHCARERCRTQDAYQRANLVAVRDEQADHRSIGKTARSAEGPLRSGRSRCGGFPVPGSGANPVLDPGYQTRAGDCRVLFGRPGLLADAECRKYLVQNLFYADGASQSCEYMAGALELGSAEFRLIFGEGVIEVRQNIAKACAMPRAGESGGASAIG